MIMVSSQGNVLLLISICAGEVAGFQPETDNERLSAAAALQHDGDYSIVVNAYGSLGEGDNSQDKLMRSESQPDVQPPVTTSGWRDSLNLPRLIQSPYLAYQKLMADWSIVQARKKNKNKPSGKPLQPNALSQLPDSSTQVNLSLDDERRNFREEIADIIKQALNETLSEYAEQTIEASERCEFDEWRDWSSCSVSCGSGIRQRIRNDLAANNASKACLASDAVEQENCSVECPDCDFGAWDDWSICTHSCGGGIRQRRRPAQNILHDSGVPCDRSLGTEHEPCHTEACNRDCTWSDWADWSACNATCGGGVKSRRRSIKDERSGQGRACSGAMNQTAECGAKICPQDCSMSEWEEWTSCRESCMGCNGTKMRFRSVSTPAVGAGSVCPGPFHQESSCQSADCQWGDWGPWTTCKPTCGTDYISSYRRQLRQQSAGGRQCDGEDVRREVCSVREPCSPIDCKWSEWNEWSDCSKTCGTGTRFRLRKIELPASSGGAACEGNEWDQTQCNGERDCGSSGSSD
eukprot:TRINITY_DN105695_c0_g1_i1.p1 TRINITY_DN105695_c0_g1~~TRINITY_DN105695_c0_g1_i1.p1  ORF type:complete len:521 (+),score=75.96 TRINITY_DN105695_c0_g1_i1:83-1645(+)